MGRISPDVQANYLASPPLVVAYALAGTVQKDLTKEPLGTGKDGKPVYLRDIWPTSGEIQAFIRKNVTRAIYATKYAAVFDGDANWKKVKAPAGETYKLEEPFFVLATQNPIEQEGTYPLPEAQLDRFMFNLWVDYPTLKEEQQIVKNTTSAATQGVSKVLNAQQIATLQDLIRRVPVADNVVEYAVKLVRKTRPASDEAPKFVKDYVSWGCGPRASQYLILGAKTRAALHGRPTPEIDDVRAVALPVLRHRLVPNFTAEADGIKTEHLVEKLLAEK